MELDFNGLREVNPVLFFDGRLLKASHNQRFVVLLITTQKRRHPGAVLN